MVEKSKVIGLDPKKKESSAKLTTEMKMHSEKILVPNQKDSLLQIPVLE